MPNIDPEAKAWQTELAARVGDAIRRARKRREWTAVDLSRRCHELGYPISRVAISKIESNSRAGKLDLAELIAIAAALDVPPVGLVFPDLPDGLVNVVPVGDPVPSIEAMRWFCGEVELPPVSGMSALVHSARERRRIERSLDIGISLLKRQSAGDREEQEHLETLGNLADQIRALDQQMRSLGGVVKEEEPENA
ncbi:helix-turn-helix domain-containing protein [Mycolicibacterium sp. XJ870]